MNKKIRKRLPESVKRQAVKDYVSGTKSAEEIASELQTVPQTIYRWRTAIAEKDKGLQINELEASGYSQEQAKTIIKLKDEIQEYQKKVAEQSIIIDLLKKLQNPNLLQPESELSGLIDTVKKSDQKRKRVKS